ncbi:gas vesicle protein [Aeromicrobium sp. SORGH_AS981]|uniref:hypothetical protein n=1 Tax=Aeromicrobium sp. SORGH_AS_0981 TaxID=3041802 RepID=UPI0028557016|nr:hypothetical protein [Aeromicrobium sp. SORGH_AS_0981]MDR6117282.1 gas vesicle protein [Aeromicrobium sp. SORGH_AS_0981]
MPDWFGNLLIGAVSASFGGGLATLILAPRQRRKLKAETDATDADAAKVITDTAMQLLNPLREQVAATQTQLEETQTQLDATRTQLDETQTELAGTRAEAAALTRELACIREEYELYRATHPPAR